MLRDGEIAVELSKTEMLIAAVVGVQREIEARAANRTNRFEPLNESFAWGKHIVGALAEAAFAKASGLYWIAGVNTFTNYGDVGRFEVRWTESYRGGPVRAPRLKIRPDERDDAIVVLVTGKAPRFVVHGWRRAGSSKRPEWLFAPTKGQPAYFVPIESLGAMYTLPGFAGRREE